MSTLPEDLLNGLQTRLKREQRALREFLTKSGIERIEPVPGSEFVAGLVEPSRLTPEPTTSPSLHKRVFRVEPGEGGFRVGNSVLCPTLARYYELCTTETSRSLIPKGVEGGDRI